MARGIFDEEEADGGKLEKRVRERGPKNEQAGRTTRGHDTELTLGTGALLGIVFGLLLVCGLCFALGYAVGHHVSASGGATATQPAAPTPAPDEEPLQGNGTIPKPSADAQAPLPQGPPGSDGTPDADGGTNPEPGQQEPAAEQPSAPASSPAAAPPAPVPAPSPTPVRPAFPGAGNGSQGGSPAAAPAAPASPASSPAVRPAPPGAAGQFMVQVAAVSHNDDAGVLVNALRKRGYAASAQREPSDGLIHVRIGPFATHDEANRMCSRLLDDGYNAIVQP